MKKTKTKRILALAIAFVLTFLQMSEIATAAEAKVTDIVASSETIGAAGGEITLTVSGTGLTADNWGITVTSYYEGTDVATGKAELTAQVKNITSQGATIVIPKNTMKNAIEYRVFAGVKTGATISKDVQISVIQDKKKDNVDLDPKSVVQVDATTINVTFPENIFLETTNMTQLKQMIFVSDYGNENSNRIELADGAALSINGNVLKINFKRALELSGNSVINIKEGALKNSEGKVLRAVSWFITYVPTVTTIDLSKDVFDCNGGSVTATLNGSHVDQILKSQIQASVYIADSIVPTDIPVSIETQEGHAPTATFTVPENTTDNTVCYYLQVKIDGNTVNEATVENSAKKAIVSVLPEGVSDAVQTLGGATITGNNKIGNVENNKDITVAVSTQEGELKTVMTLYGTNLDSKLTKVRAIDENGIVWPVYDIPE